MTHNRFHSVKGVPLDKSGQDVCEAASEHMVGTTDNNNAYNSEIKSDVRVSDTFASKSIEVVQGNLNLKQRQPSISKNTFITFRFHQNKS